MKKVLTIITAIVLTMNSQAGVKIVTSAGVKKIFRFYSGVDGASGSILGRRSFKLTGGKMSSNVIDIDQMFYDAISQNRVKVLSKTEIELTGIKIPETSEGVLVKLHRYIRHDMIDTPPVRNSDGTYNIAINLQRLNSNVRWLTWIRNHKKFDKQLAFRDGVFYSVPDEKVSAFDNISAVSLIGIEQIFGVDNSVARQLLEESIFEFLYLNSPPNELTSPTAIRFYEQGSWFIRDFITGQLSNPAFDPHFTAIDARLFDTAQLLSQSHKSLVNLLILPFPVIIEDQRTALLSWIDDVILGMRGFVIPPGIDDVPPPPESIREDFEAVNTLLDIELDAQDKDFELVGCWNDADLDDAREYTYMAESFRRHLGFNNVYIHSVRGDFGIWRCLFKREGHVNLDEPEFWGQTQQGISDFVHQFDEWYENNKHVTDYFMLGIRLTPYLPTDIIDHFNRYIIAPSDLFPQVLAETGNWTSEPLIMDDGELMVATNNPDLSMANILKGADSVIATRNSDADYRQGIVEIVYSTKDNGAPAIGIRDSINNQFHSYIHESATQVEHDIANITNSFAQLVDVVSQVYEPILSISQDFSRVASDLYERLLNWNDLSHVIVSENGQLVLDETAITDCDSWRLAGAFAWRGFTEPVNVHPADGLDRIFAGLLETPRPCDCDDTCVQTEFTPTEPEAEIISPPDDSTGSDSIMTTHTTPTPPTSEGDPIEPEIDRAEMYRQGFHYSSKYGWVTKKQAKKLRKADRKKRARKYARERYGRRAR